MKFSERFQMMNPTIRSIVIILTLIIVGLIIGYVIASATTPNLINQITKGKPHGLSGQPPTMISGHNFTQQQLSDIIQGYTITVMILSVEIVLLFGLIGIYTDIFSKTKSKYLIGFLLFVIVFLMKSISQLIAMTPLFANTLSQAPGVISPLIRGTFGPFGIFFSIFEIIAICILIYISSE
jgi:hypothetical protein